MFTRELLDRVKSFEDEQFSNKKSSYQAPKLEPVNDTGGTMLLREVELVELISKILEY